MRQFYLQDIRILRDLGYDVTVATSFGEIPWNSDLYFSWWAAGSVLPLVKARLRGKPIIVVTGGHDSIFYRDSVSGTPVGYLAAPWYKQLASRLSLRFGTTVVAVSSFMLDDVRRLGARSPMVVPNSIDTDTFRPSGDKRQHVTTVFELEDGAVRKKRGEVFIRCIPIVLGAYPEQTFVVIGSKGNAYERLRALVSDLGIERRVEFLGGMNNREVAGWFQRSTMYVQISDSETFGVAIAEAMSTGTPVVVSRRGSIPEVVGNEAVFVDHNDPESVAAGIISVLRKTDEERQSIGAAARARIVEHFSYEKRRAAFQRIAELALRESRGESANLGD